ncbi:MAG: SDR family oxidoreductase [Pseudomonadota bacterium]
MTIEQPTGPGPRFTGKTALITGGAAGLGRASAELILREGGQVVVLDRDEGTVEEFADTDPDRVLGLTCDVRDGDQVAEAVGEAVSKFGGLDLVFSNAGTSGPNSTVDQVRDEDFDRMMHLHVRAAFALLRETVPHLKARGGGSFLMTTSVSGLKQGYAPVLYSLSKGVLVRLAEIAAVELAQHRIRVNCICPGFVPTQIFARSMGFKPKTAEKFARRLDDPASRAQPLPRACTPEDIAEAVGYLGSDAGSFVTGQTLVVDGGLSLTPGAGDTRDVYAPIIAALGFDPAEIEPGPAVWAQLGLGKDRPEDAE